MPSIKCTNCGAVLKTANEIPPGKKVKCPKCTQVFIVAPEELEPVAAEEPVDEGDSPFGGLGGGAGDDEAPKPKKKGKPVEDDEDAADGEGDEDDAPRKKGKGKISDEDDDGGDKPKKKNNTTMILIIVGVLLLCCCGCGGVGTIFRAAISAAIGIGDAAGKGGFNKQFEDAMKKAEEEMKKQQQK